MTQAAIIEATARILEKEGRAGLTTNHIAERAGVSIGSLYQYFPNKEAVLAAVLRREWSALLLQVQAISALTGHTAKQTVALMIDVALEHQFARPRMALELEYIEGSLDMDTDLSTLSQALGAEALRILCRLDAGADAQMAQDVVAICKGLVNAAALAGETDQAAIRRRLYKAVFGYLGVPFKIE